MVARASLRSGGSRDQVRLKYKNTLYNLEREKAVLLCMVNEYMRQGVKNLGEVPNLVIQNRKVDDIIVQEMRYRKMLGILS